MESPTQRPVTLAHIPLELIDPPRTNCRSVAGDVDDLARSIRVHGMLTPLRLRPVEDGLPEEPPADRVLLDLPEPWKLVKPVAAVLRPGGIFLCYVPTIIQSHQIAEALQHDRHWALVETFETLYRPWNIEGQSVRPFHRMVAHTGFITTARRVVPEEGGPPPAARPLDPDA